MTAISEQALQMYWLSMIVRGSRVTLVDGRVAEVLSPGIWNRDAGPDFSNARIRIEGRVWAGNVEMHVRASDWYRHGHDGDEAYGSVILHVVCADDGRVTTSGGHELPQASVSLPEHFLKSVDVLTGRGEPYMRCALTDGFLRSLSGLQVCDWLSTLLAERCRGKADAVTTLHKRLNADWRQTAFAVLARALGFGINAEPMESLAASLPLNTIERHSDSLFRIEALLFGKAGMLPGSDHMFDEYYQALAQEFGFLGHKYSIRPLYGTSWKLARTRPANFPYRRIAQLAAYCLGGFTFAGDVMEFCGSARELCGLFDRDTSEYWRTHYSFNSESRCAPQRMTEASRRLLCVNAAVPLLFAYGLMHGRADLCARAEDVLAELPAEQTAQAARWRRMGIPVKCAADTQALHHLYTQYCSRNRCAECRWGTLLLRYMASDAAIASEHYTEYKKSHHDDNSGL